MNRKKGIFSVQTHHCSDCTASNALSCSLSLSLSHNHTHTHSWQHIRQREDQKHAHFDNFLSFILSHIKTPQEEIH